MAGSLYEAPRGSARPCRGDRASRAGPRGEAEGSRPLAADQAEEGIAVLADDGGTDAGDGQQALLVARTLGGDGDEHAVGEDAEGRDAAAPGLGGPPGSPRPPQGGGEGAGAG